MVSSSAVGPLHVAASVGLSVAVGISWWRRWLLERHGVATTFLAYARLRYRLLGGWKKLIVVADFDRTITTARCGTSCHGVVESCAELSAEYKKATAKLFEHYYPIETSATLTREEKIPLMQEWYHQAHTLLLAEPFTPTLLDSAAKRSAVALRPGFAELFTRLHDNGAPLVVCSAGLGNVIRAVLLHLLPARQAGRAERVPIVSNWLHFDAKGVVSAFSQPLLHMFNKDGAWIRSHVDGFDVLSQDRDVVMLLGDGLGDATMADGLGIQNVVKVGFLNETAPDRVSARLPAYRRAFDVVLLGDQSFEWINALLRSL